MKMKMNQKSKRMTTGKETSGTLRRWCWAASPALLLIAMAGCENQAPTAASSDVEKRVAAIETKLTEAEAKLTATEAKLAATEAKLARFEIRLTAAERRPAAPAVATAAPAADAPKIFSEQPIHDFGTTWIGESLKHTFSLTNRGKTPLKILNVKPGCGCTVAGSYPRELSPGATGQFPFTMDSKKLRGRYTKYITITTNDPANKTYKLTLRGTLKRYVEITPASAYFGNILGSEPKVKTLKIKNNADEPLEISLTPPTTDQFKFELIEKTPGKEYDLVVTTLPPYTPGALNATATLNTNLGETKTIQVKAVARVPQRIETQPTAIRLSRPRPGRPSVPITKPVYVRNYGDTPVKVLEASVNDPSVTATVDEKVAGKTYSIQVKFPANYTPPATGVALTIKTDDAEKPEIKVPIQGPTTPRPKPPSADTLIGQKAPRFEATTLAGKPVKQSDPETVTVLNFFAANCGFCKKQLPRLEAIRKQYAGKPVRFVNVSQTMFRKRYTDEQITSLLDGLGVEGELVTDADNAIGPKFRATSYPTLVVVGKTGTIDAVTVGNKADLDVRVKGALDALLAGKPVPTVAAPPRPIRTVPSRSLGRGRGRGAPAVRTPALTPLPTPVPPGDGQ